MTEAPKCAICYDEFDKPFHAVSLGCCTATYHRGCLTAAGQRAANCPTCRAALLNSTRIGTLVNDLGQIWYRDDQLHREDGPAFFWDGIAIWYQDG